MHTTKATCYSTKTDDLYRTANGCYYVLSSPDLAGREWDASSAFAGYDLPEGAESIANPTIDSDEDNARVTQQIAECDADATERLGGWKHTHTITLTGDGEAPRSYEVYDDGEGSLYTRQEWADADSAVWTRDDDGGVPAPQGNFGNCEWTVSPVEAR